MHLLVQRQEGVLLTYTAGPFVQPGLALSVQDVRIEPVINRRSRCAICRATQSIDV